MKKLLYHSAIVLLAACGGSSERTDGFSKAPATSEDSLFEQVMGLHDEAMAKMGRLAGRRKEADAKPDLALSKELLQAENNMNKWMEEFSIDSAQDDSEKRIAYLTSEKSKVATVRDEILAVLAKADSTLKK